MGKEIRSIDFSKRFETDIERIHSHVAKNFTVSKANEVTQWIVLEVAKLLSRKNFTGKSIKLKGRKERCNSFILKYKKATTLIVYKEFKNGNVLVITARDGREKPLEFED